MRTSTLWAVAASSIAIVAVHAAPAAAQDTTSAISGQITREGGAALAGATVTAVHIPTGTRQTVTTDGAGNYAMRGLPVGGPYTVTVDARGYTQQIIDNISLTIGDTLGLPVEMGSREVVVTGTRLRGPRELTTGSQTAFNADQIKDIVSVRRDIRDVMRRDLLSTYNANVGGVSIAGGNIRTQRFSVDGVQIQDSFGLNYGGLPSTRGIVSLEMVDQLSVKAAPFDVSEGNFQGGAVNVVLKSGTNQFHASAFGDWGGPSLTGRLTRDNRGVVGDVYPVSATKILDFSNYGGSVSGPIIKDKLFFFASYEQLSEGTPNPYGIAGGSAPNPIPGLTQAQVDNTTNLFNSSGYDKYPIGTIVDAIAEKDKKWAGKVDWNIMEGQRLTASYIHHENVIPNFGSAGSTSTSTPYVALQSDIYRLTEYTNAFAAQLNSKWTDALSTELRASYKYYRRGQDPYNSPDYAQINVCQDQTSSTLANNTTPGPETLCGTGVPIVRLGPDTPRQANAFNQHTLNLQGNATLRAGTHLFKAEFDHMNSKLYNLFSYTGNSTALGGSGTNGLYYFDSTSDFASRTATELAATAPTVGPKSNAYVAWAYTVNTAAFQDTWAPISTLKINAGLRYDFYSADRSIQLNPNFVNRFSLLYPGLSNASTLNGRVKLQPRAGFNWAITDSLKLVGGAGLFAGGLSDVFVSNNYSNSGVAINGSGAALASIDLVRTANGCVDKITGANSAVAGSSLTPAICTAALNNVTGSNLNPAVLAYLQGNTSTLAKATTNSLDPNFKIPAQWKYNASLNWSPTFAGTSWFLSGWNARADALLSKAQQAVRWIDLRAQPLVANGVVQVAPDGRPRYGGYLTTTGGLVAPGSNQDIQLTNTTKGRSLVLAAGLTKHNQDVDFMVGYTHQDVKDVAGILVSSTVSSTYSIPTSDPNSGGDYGRSAFEVTSTIRAAFDIHHKFFGDNETRFGINFEHRSGQPYSATMFDNTSSGTGCVASSVGGDTGRACVFGTALNTSSHLLYVPNFALTPTTAGLAAGQTQYGNVIFADAATLAAVQTLVNGTDLKNYQGRIAPKNLLTGPSYNKVDLNFSQQIPFFYSKITGLFSIENFLNLLNRNWGSYQDIGSTSVVRVACAGATTNGQTCPNYVYSVYTAPKTTTYPKASLWALRLGVRIDF